MSLDMVMYKAIIQSYLRVNLVCPPSTLKEGFIRMARVLSQYGPDSVDVGCPR
jgi:hypothetical protein